MIYFETWYKEFMVKEIKTSEEISFILANFCSEALVSEKDMHIFDYYAKGKRQREISLIFNMHQPLVSRSINLTRQIVRNVHSFVYHQNVKAALGVAKNILTDNEYDILNYRLVGYTFKDIGEKVGVSTQYIGLANKYIMAKLSKYLKNDNLSLLFTYLKKINSYWSKKARRKRKKK